MFIIDAFGWFMLAILPVGIYLTVKGSVRVHTPEIEATSRACDFMHDNARILAKIRELREEADRRWGAPWLHSTARWYSPLPRPVGGDETTLMTSDSPSAPCPGATEMFLDAQRAYCYPDC